MPMLHVFKNINFSKDCSFEITKNDLILNSTIGSLSARNYNIQSSVVYFQDTLFSRVYLLRTLFIFS